MGNNTNWQNRPVTGFLVQCPYCGEQTMVKASRIVNETPVWQLPNWERDVCQKCERKIIIHVDVRVIATNKDEGGS